MSADSLDALLAKLCSGDTAAAEQVFVAYEPYLRMVVRRQLPAKLRSKFDSMDVVQSIWGDLLQGFRKANWSFADVAHLRAFLVKVTRHRLIDRARQYQKAAAHEQPLAGTDGEGFPPSLEATPSKVAQADELWEQMLALCPPAHHELLRLKRQGYSLAEIAARTGLHESSVRRILYELAERLGIRKPRGESSSPEGVLSVEC